MNSRRLSNSAAVTVNRELLYKEINLMLSKPSNLEVRNGNIWIISLIGLLMEWHRMKYNLQMKMK